MIDFQNVWGELEAGKYEYRPSHLELALSHYSHVLLLKSLAQLSIRHGCLFEMRDTLCTSSWHWLLLLQASSSDRAFFS